MEGPMGKDHQSKMELVPQQETAMEVQVLTSSPTFHLATSEPTDTTVPEHSRPKMGDAPGGAMRKVTEQEVLRAQGHAKPLSIQPWNPSYKLMHLEGRAQASSSL